MACTCIKCRVCEGKGYMWQDPITKEMSRYRCDDLSEMIECPFCDTDGLESACDECIERNRDEELSKGH